MRISALAAGLACALLLTGTPSGSAEPLPGFPPLPSQAALQFQQKLTGMLPAATRELRWALSFTGKTAKLSATTRSCKLSMRGGESGSPPCREPFVKAVSYSGKLKPRPYGIDIWLEARPAPENFPSEMTLRCLRTVVSVLPASATLLPGDACDGSSPPPRWQPAQGKDVALWHCEIDSESATPWIGYSNVGPFFFAASPGVEWVYVNNDCAGQEGAFRFPAETK